MRLVYDAQYCLEMKSLLCKRIVGKATLSASLLSFRHTCESTGGQAAER